jgi:Spy/CpxP family protein refolding chaperone
MKKNSRRPKLRFATLLTASSLCALTVFAQPAADGKPVNRPLAGRQFPRGDRPGGGFQPGGMGGGQFLPMLQRVLTEEQRASLRSAMEAQREKARDLEEKLRDARRELLKASVLDPFDEDSVRSKALEVGKLDAEMTVLRAKAFAKMKPALSPEQIEQFKNPPPLEGGGQNQIPRRSGRVPAGPRDENDLPLPPKADK